MKKLLKISIILLFILMTLINLCGCKKSEEEQKNALKEKINTELSYIDSELVSILNALNNINYSKYKAITQEVESITGSDSGSSNTQTNQGGQGGEGSVEQQQDEQTNQQEGKGESSKQSSEDRNSQESGESSNSNEEGNDSSNAKQESESSGKSNKIFSMQANNMLGKEEDAEIDWDELKNKIENLYTTWTVVSLDLGKVGVSEEELNNFSKTMDNVALAIKNENKEETITTVIDLYSFLSKFINVYSTGSKEQNVIDTKYKLLVCYKYADLENWDELNSSINDLKMSFSNILNKKEEFEGKEININCAKIILDEIDNGVDVRDRDIFFIKYKNFIQELNIILSI